MPDPKLIAVITAMMFVAGTQGANAAYNLSQLQEIERLVLDSNCGGLLGYLKDNPGISAGDDVLAQELRSFENGVEGGIINCLSVAPGGGGGTRQDLGAAY